MYSIYDYGRMVQDQARMDPYALALKKAVHPESVVLDLGAGTGIHALLACKFGARRVYAIEPNEAVALAQALAAENGFSDRIEFIQDVSTAVTLPEAADIIVSDLRGVLPLFDQHIPAIIDARQRHLAAGGVLIPQRDLVYAAVVQAPQVYADLIAPWQDPYGLQMASARRHVLNTWTDENTDLIQERHLLTAPCLWVDLAYEAISQPDVSGPPLDLQVLTGGTAHGLFLYFDTDLFAGIGFSNAPGAQKTAEVYGRAFFPFLEPILVEPGDKIRAAIQAHLQEDGYLWHWQTQILAGTEETVVKAEFSQSSQPDPSGNPQR